MGEQKVTEFEGSVIVHGVLGIDAFPDGSPSGGLDMEGQLFMRNGFVTANHGVATSNIVSTQEDARVLVDGVLGVTQDLNVNGTVNVLGDVRLLGADIAELFEVVDDAATDPGSVVVLAGDDCVSACFEPYDRRVAGVVAGACGYRPAIVLDDRQEGSNRRPVALSGRVWCKVDADPTPVGVGDMLTTSGTPGYAMKADDPLRAFGAVIGKALRSLNEGQGIIPVLIALQ